MKILKFGGKSLANGEGLQNVIEIIESKYQQGEKFAVVLSARGGSTDQLEFFLEQARKGVDFSDEWEAFKAYQLEPDSSIDLEDIFTLLKKIFDGVTMVEDYSLKVKDLVLAQGELLSARVLTALLNKKGVDATFVDTREIFKTGSNFGAAHINLEKTEKKTSELFSSLSKDTIPIVTGFIASNKHNETTTLGRNGSNYSASLLAQLLNAEEVLNYTHINGIYTANPELVENAKIIEKLTYQEASEIASFGASILHAKTIIPLIKSDIPFRILNTFNRDNHGTLICKQHQDKGVKSISVKSDVSIVSIEGKGMLGKLGMDSRIFTSLYKADISIGVISQGSSERAIGFIIDTDEAEKGVEVLKKEFKREIADNDVSRIYAIHNASVVTVVGQSINNFHTSLELLAQNNINILLINNTINGKNISLVVEDKDVNKTINIIHSRIFGVAKNINIAIIGKGNVGSNLIDQILNSKEKILTNKAINLNIFAIANSSKILLNKNGVSKDWENEFEQSKSAEYSIQKIIDYAKTNHFENLVAIDNTANAEFIENYINFVENGFDLISSNKIANTISYGYYQKLRKTLKKHKKKYLYETNVGAGLPLIDTIRLLHDSGENITAIRGVFSGSLSYIFNKYSENDDAFSLILQEAIDKGFTEPDPREDLCGKDVARKLLILARELDLKNEMSDIEIEDLIPEPLRKSSTEEFLGQLDQFDEQYSKIKQNQKPDHVLRYIGDLSGDLQQEKGVLKTALVSVPKSSPLGQLRGSDSIFEIFTESYGEKPIVIQGAGAGAEVTARGVFGDLLRIADKK